MNKIYLGYDKSVGSQEGAVLIFAASSKDARKLGWGTMKSFHGTAWVDMAVRLMRKNLDYLAMEATSDQPHVITDMRICPKCELWGEDRNEDHCGYCDERA